MSTTTRRHPLERWSPSLFLVGGGLMVGHAGMLGVQAFTNLTTPADVFGPTGHLLALLGLLGLHPTLADRSPTVARVANFLVAVALVGWSVMTVTRFLTVAGFVSSVGNVIPGTFFLLIFASTILTYALFGVTTVRIDDNSRVVGLLVLAPAVLIVVALVDSAITGVTAIEGLVIGSGLALSMLALGHTLRTWDRPAALNVTSGDLTVG